MQYLMRDFIDHCEYFSVLLISSPTVHFCVKEEFIVEELRHHHSGRTGITSSGQNAGQWMRQFNRIHRARYLTGFCTFSPRITRSSLFSFALDASDLTSDSSYLSSLFLPYDP